MQFSVKVSSYQKNITLNICDSKLLGKNTVSLSIELGIGSENAIKTISDVPFLIVFKE